MRRFFRVFRGLGFGLASSLVVSAGTPVAPPPAQSGPDGDFLAEVRRHFAAWDRDGDGALSAAEVELAIADPGVRGPAAAAAAALRGTVGGRNGTPRTLSLEAVAGLTRRAVPAEEEGGEISVEPPEVEQRFASGLNRIARAPDRLFASGAPQLAGFRQGRLGSCYALAPLAALIHRDPAQAAHLFALQEDGTVLVRFGDGRTVRVTRPSDGEIALASTSGDAGYWNIVFEKAVGIVRAPEAGEPDRPTPLSVASRGGSAGTMLSLITGREIERFSCRPFLGLPPPAATDPRLTSLRRLLVDTFQARRLATAGTLRYPANPPKFRGVHAYAVLGYDEVADVVTVRDPHAHDYTPDGQPGLVHGYPTRAGLVRIPLAEMVTFFSGFAFETGRPLPVAAP